MRFVTTQRRANVFVGSGSHLAKGLWTHALMLMKLFDLNLIQMAQLGHKLYTIHQLGCRDHVAVACEKMWPR